MHSYFTFSHVHEVLQVLFSSRSRADSSVDFAVPTSHRAPTQIYLWDTVGLKEGDTGGATIHSSAAGHIWEEQHKPVTDLIKAMSNTSFSECTGVGCAPWWLFLVFNSSLDFWTRCNEPIYCHFYLCHWPDDKLCAKAHQPGYNIILLFFFFFP